MTPAWLETFQTLTPDHQGLFAPLIYQGDEVIDELGDELARLAKWAHMQWDHCQSVVEIAAKLGMIEDMEQLLVAAFTEDRLMPEGNNAFTTRLLSCASGRSCTTAVRR